MSAAPRAAGPRRASRCARPSASALLALVLAGCTLQRTGFGEGGDASLARDADTARDARVAMDGATEPDASDAQIARDAPMIDAPRDAAGCVPTCTGDELLDCSTDPPTPRTCQLGCSTVGTPHCQLLDPSNVAPTLFVDGGDVLIDADTDWSTDACGALPGMPTLTTQEGGGSICVVRVRSLDVRQRLRVRGSVPLAILALETIDVSGSIDAAAALDVPGAGGAGPSSGSHAGSDGDHEGVFADGGGGGAGFAAFGGQGGGGGPALGGAGAAGVAATYMLEPLVGGSGGGRGGTGEGAGVGGAGGGALQLSARVRIRIDGDVLVGGGGGGGGGDGTLADANLGAGGGGGSGGALLIEAPEVDLSGARLVAAGGGGGGAAGCSTRGDAEPGVDGRAHDRRAAGGAAGRDCGGGLDYGAMGGAGGGLALAAGDLGGTNGDTSANGGGGGGGAGFVLVRTADGTMPGGATFNPTLAPAIRSAPVLRIP